MAAVPTTPGNAQGVPPIAQTSTNAMEDTFQNLFDTGRINESTQVTEEPRATQPNPQEIAEAAQEEPSEVEALGGEETAEAEEVEYASLEEFLGKHQLDPETFTSLPVKVKIDGKTQEVPLADVIKSYQLEGHVNNKSIELSNAQKEFEQTREAVATLWREQLNNAKALGDLAQQQLMAEFQQINWSELQRTDPVQWTVQQQLFNNRAAAINQHLQQVAAAREAQARQLQEQQAALLPKEREKMLEARPEWRDPAKFDADTKVMSSYAKKIGFSDAELNALSDHRYMQVLHDAAQFRALQAKNPETLKRVRAAPQMARPGTRTQRDAKSVAKQQAMERFQKNPRDVDAQSAFFETLF